MITRGSQEEYFSGVRYRDPENPAVRAYAEPKLDFIQRHLSLKGHILDVGCGNGVFTSRLARAGAQVTGLDFSRQLLAQNRHPFLTCADVTALPFAPATFDIAFEANVLHHVPDRLSVIREMARVSRRHVILLEPNRYNPLMFGFSVLVAAERGGLKSCLHRLETELRQAGLRLQASITTGMISQNNTPEILIPFLKRFDRQVWWGEYIIVIATL